jgi:hypothetical protein
MKFLVASRSNGAFVLQRTSSPCVHMISGRNIEAGNEIGCR